MEISLQLSQTDMKLAMENIENPIINPLNKLPLCCLNENKPKVSSPFVFFCFPIKKAITTNSSMLNSKNKRSGF
jgi:hypothetical protein